MVKFSPYFHLTFAGRGRIPLPCPLPRYGIAHRQSCIGIPLDTSKILQQWIHRILMRSQPQEGHRVCGYTLIRGGEPPPPDLPKFARVCEQSWTGVPLDISCSQHWPYRAQGLPQRRGVSPKSVTVCGVRSRSTQEQNSPGPVSVNPPQLELMLQLLLSRLRGRHSGGA